MLEGGRWGGHLCNFYNVSHKSECYSGTDTVFVCVVEAHLDQQPRTFILVKRVKATVSLGTTTGSQ